MATVDKNFKVKNGLIVGDSTNLVNYTSASPSDPFVGQLWIDSDEDSSVGDLSAYLTLVDASELYLRVDTASSRYLPISASSNYLPVSASSNYLPVSASANYLPTGIVNAKGDLVTATANDTPAILTAGSNGQMLMADSAATAGLRYVDPPTNRNIVINGAMQVNQYGSGTSTSGGYYASDRFRYGRLVSTPSVTHSVEADAPTGSGLRNSYKVLYNDAVTPSAGTQATLTQRIEGFNVQQIRKGTAQAKELTLSFWVKASVTGTYIARLHATEAVSKTYSVNAAHTWEYKTMTFPADTSGTAISNDNALGLALVFGLIAGSNYTSGTLQTTWAAVVDADTYVGQVNVAATASNYWQVTGVQLETGLVATPFEFEPFEATLRKCQRYYYLHASGNAKIMFMGANYSASEIDAVCHFPTSMRTAPSLTIASGTNYYRFDRNCGQDYVDAMVIGYAQENAAGMYNNTQVSGTAGDGGWIYTNNAAASVAFSAEL